MSRRKFLDERKTCGRKVGNERWALALIAADDGNLGELVRALLVVATVPEWVRKDLAGEDYDELPLSGDDVKLLRWREAYRKFPRRKGEKEEERVKRFLTERPRAPRGLEYLLRGRGRPARRLSRRFGRLG